MPRGRHRHSPPLHRLLPPSAIAGVSVVCALGPWAFSEATVLRALAAAAAATAVVGAVVMRRWDIHAGKQVAELARARASDEWRNEERVAELETDLEESRELRTKLEQRLRAKRAELAGLRNEHAALLRRYATAETERASALEGRRQLEIEAAVPSSAPALPPARSAEPEPEPEPAQAEAKQAAGPADGGEPTAHAVFSAEGARLYLRALTALARFDRETAAESESESESESEPRSGSESAVSDVEADEDVVAEADTALGATAFEGAPSVAEELGGTGADDSDADDSDADDRGAQADFVVEGEADARTAVADDGSGGSVAKGEDVGESADAGAEGAAGDGVTATVTDDVTAAVTEDAGAGRNEAVPVPVPATPVAQPPAGHFTVPTAVAVVPAAPARRPMVEGGFDFFGTQKAAPKAQLDSVHNEDLADVVGAEALAVHKAETESEFKPADAQSHEGGQVIDLTAHDETEHIDVKGLRTAAS
ncbi:hypothetical protein [Streptomyces broussonetiae]|uniref:hypothetical protein n=1 Tax=Streptomyces broussonetiae TaxID=2686304 RepID=UPI0035DC46B6